MHPMSHLRRIVIGLASSAAFLLAPVGTAGSLIATSTGGLAVVGPHVATSSPTTPPTSAQCAAATGGVVLACYGPYDLRNQYDFNPVYAGGDTGAGQTIVIFDSFGSPTIKSDLQSFDQAYGLPDPPSFNIYEPEGNVTYPYTNAGPGAANNKNFATEINWGYETTLDVEWSHAMAPGANIALVVTPVAETEGVQGLQNLENAQSWALSHHLGTVWSDSFATTEQSFHNDPIIHQLDNLYAQAASQGVSAFFATGDTGAANVDKQGAIYPYPTVTFPGSSPNVIAVGGTEIPAPPPTISSYQPESTWNDCCGSGGGGFSSIFSEPSFQSTAAIADASGTRGLPDVSYNAALVSSILVYESFDPAGAGWVIIGGTSAAAPQWAAIDALANDADGPLGFLAPRLYQIAANPPAYASAFHDITTGNNSFAGVTGYNAAPGWDPATGLGTPDVAHLITALESTTP